MSDDAYTLRGGVDLDLGKLIARLRAGVDRVVVAGKAMESALAVEATVDADQPVEALRGVSEAAGRVVSGLRETSATPVTVNASPAVAAVAALDGELRAVLAEIATAGRTPVRLDAAPASSAIDRLDGHVDQLVNDFAQVNATPVRMETGPAERGVRDLHRELDAAVAAAARLNNVGLDDLADPIGDAARAAQDLLAPLGLLPGRVGELAARAGALANTLTGAAGGVGGFAERVATLREGAAVLAGELAGAGTAIAAVGLAAVAAAPFVVGLGATLLALNSTPVQLAASMEQTKIAFTTLTGSAANADRTLRDLKVFADTTPFEFPEIAGAAKQLIAMGIEADQVTDRLRTLGNIGSGLGQPLGELAYLFGQIKSQGRAMTQDLNQFAGRGVPIYAALAKVLKTNELGVRELAEVGKIGFAQIAAQPSMP